MSEEIINETVDQTTQTSGEEQTETTSEKVEEKVFKQEDVNNIVAKESKKATEKLLKELGIDDFENAKDGLAKFKEWQESQKTEAEKQQETLQNLEKEKETLSATNQSLQAQISAMKQGVVADSVEDVVALAERLVSDDVTIDDAIKQVVEKYPHFAQQQQQEEQQEEPKPQFTTGQHQSTGSNVLDPFKAKMAKYSQK